jgi:ATP-binding protein involved in chromosome partitioning
MVESCGYKRSHFGDEVVVDLVLHTPAMHIKKRAEDDIKTIHDLVSP